MSTVTKEYNCPYKCDLDFGKRLIVRDWIANENGPEGDCKILLWHVVFELESDMLIYRLKFL